MVEIDLDCLRTSIGPLFGIDPGTKTLGLAISDSTRLIASPLETIWRKTFRVDAQRLLQVYDKNRASAVVVGLPVNMDGSHGPRTQSVQDFCTNLQKIRDLPVFLWDERMSTIAVTRTMLADNMSRRKRAANVDKLAATYILQGVLDRLRARDRNR
ncbi:MAG: Holliday junction resolvase RuvX [Hyphomonadaceae bacterium]|nr:Holliday junction resolvase RuvX [Hyphomonadaceae bacterium]MBC6412555.1 Holliday junction resolvase RuvX [Hyphomonadaceae bacterium]